MNVNVLSIIANTPRFNTILVLTNIYKESLYIIKTHIYHIYKDNYNEFKKYTQFPKWINGLYIHYFDDELDYILRHKDMVYGLDITNIKSMGKYRGRYVDNNIINVAMKIIDVCCNIQEINISYTFCMRALMHIPYTHVNLRSLDIKWTNTKCLPKTLVNLEYLNIQHTVFCSNGFQEELIHDTYVKLKYLDCSFSAVTTIPFTLVNLEYLDCSRTYVIIIPHTLINLKELNVCSSLVTYIPNTLTQLKTLKCLKSQHIEIPLNIKNNLEIIYC